MAPAPHGIGQLDHEDWQARARAARCSSCSPRPSSSSSACWRIVIDVTWYWTNSLKVQRAADAAALAGAVWLPDQPRRRGPWHRCRDAERLHARRRGHRDGRAERRARHPAGHDGLGTGSHVLHAAVRDQLIQATRTAKAEYVLPVPMGSPLNYFGAFGTLRGGYIQTDTGWSYPTRTQTDYTSPGVRRPTPGPTRPTPTSTRARTPPRSPRPRMSSTRRGSPGSVPRTGWPRQLRTEPDHHARPVPVRGGRGHRGRRPGVLVRGGLPAPGRGHRERGRRPGRRPCGGARPPPTATARP